MDLIKDKGEFKILVVDDSEIVRAYLLDTLSGAGYTDVEEAESGVKALELLEGDDYHLLLLDIQMPEMDGLEVLQNGKVLQPNCQFIIITGHGTLETAIEAIDLGAFSYVTKPFGENELVLARIEAALERVAVVKYNIDMINRLQLISHKIKRVQREKNENVRFEQTQEALERLTAIIDELQEFRRKTLRRGDPTD